MLSIATFNLCNLGLEASPSRVERLAHIMAEDLGGPDIMAVQEISAITDTDAYRGQVPATAAYRVLTQNVLHAGGPDYGFREVPPLADRDGGQRGFNIRTGLLFNPDRVMFRDRGPGGPKDPTGIRIVGGRPEFTLSPGRLSPADPAFEGDHARHWLPSRKVLLGEFVYGDEPLFVIACHLKSQRAANRREAEYGKKQRHAQANAIFEFVRNLLTCAPGARVVVLGDMNDVIGSKTLQILKGALLVNLLERLPRELRYTRLHGSQRQALDHVLVSHALTHGARVDIPHANSDDPRPDRGSDHDPVLALLQI